MGYSSYCCKHCDLAILSHDATDEGLNEWMAEVVMLNDEGSRLVVPKYSGYAGQYEEFALNGSVWVHKACWELAGKPEFESYDGPSLYDPNQGAGGKDCLVVDPRVTDEDERARLLAVGLEKRAERQYYWKAHTVEEWMQERRQASWRQRFSCYAKICLTETGALLRDADGNVVEDPESCVYYDILDDAHTEHTFKGSKAECEAHLASLWDEFMKSDECKAYLDFLEERRAS